MGLISDRRNKARKEKEAAAAAQAAILQVKNGFHHNGGSYQHHLAGPHGIIPTNHHPIIHHHQNPLKNGIPPQKKGYFNSQMVAGQNAQGNGARRNGAGNMLPQKYPPGYYTTPVHHTSANALNSSTSRLDRDNNNSSWSHPGAPRFQPNVNPRYQTWVAPRKQPSLGQLVRTFC